MGSLDYRLEQLVNAPAGTHPLWDGLLIHVADWAAPAFALALLVWFLIGWWRGAPRDRQAALAGLAAALLALLINLVIGHLYFRPRPFVAHPQTVHLLVSHVRDASFPSDHAAAGFAIAGVLFRFRRRWGSVLLLTAALVCYARVYVGDHYPGDVLGGAAIGIIAAGFVTSPLWPLLGTAQRIVDSTLVFLHFPFRDRLRPVVA